MIASAKKNSVRTIIRNDQTSRSIALLVVGDEILHGRVQDENSVQIARFLDARGLELSEIRVVGDDRTRLRRTISHLNNEHGTVFICGGIGPTHDDITVACVADCLGIELEVRKDLLEMANLRWPGEITPARLKLATLPIGATLLGSSNKFVAGFAIGRMFVLPGSPGLIRQSLEAIDHFLPPQAVPHSVSLLLEIKDESSIADALTEVASHHSQVSIGSYPRREEGSERVEIVIRGHSETDVTAARSEVQMVTKSLGIRCRFGS